MNQIADFLLKENNIGYALFNKNYSLLETSKNLSKLLLINEINSTETLFDIFPEFIGSENEVELIRKGDKPLLKINKVNKFDKKGNIKYLDLSIRLSSHKNKLIVIVSDSTNESLLEQKINQQQNEISILKESLTQFKNDSFYQILGKSSKIKEVRRFIKKVAPLKETSILLTGESGTGKTLIARAIHNLSKNNSPFVEINCAAIPAALLESEIFGHTKGAFTNAIENKIGLLEEADGGTLFLDEIGELSISLQPKLLSFLETKKFRPVGSTKEIQVSTRIITATNRDLKKAVKEKQFREDLFYRINVVSLEIPPLREREEDILILADYFMNIFSLELNKVGVQLTNKAKQKMLNYHWPGNIRELKNTIERAIIFCEKSAIEDDEILLNEINDNAKSNDQLFLPKEGISLVDLEKKYLLEALKITNGNQSKAAKLLHLTLDTFRYRLKKHKVLTKK